MSRETFKYHGSLDLKFCRPTKKKIRELAEALKAKDSTISKLVLKNMGESGVVEIAQALATNNSLTRLDLHDNSISDHGATEIANALKINTTLIYLDLAENLIGAKGAVNIVRALQGNTSLIYLDLGKNRITDSGGLEIEEALLPDTSLGALHLSYNGISYSVKERIDSFLCDESLREQKWKMMTTKSARFPHSDYE